MSPLRFHSGLATKIQDFINLRRSLCRNYQKQASRLGYFDRFLVDQELNEPRITRQTTDSYQQSLLELAPGTQHLYFGLVRQFCKYLAMKDPLSYVPEPLRIIPSRLEKQAYIYSFEEIQSLLKAASRLSPSGSLRPHTYYTLLGLLYSTGIRIGEAIALNLNDFHRFEQLIYIAEGKFQKARWVPLCASACQAVQNYLRRRLSMTPRSSDSPLFINQRSRRLNCRTVCDVFHKVLEQCGIDNNKNARRIHNLRHAFAVHRLLAWYREGKDVNAQLPALATYMGHVNIRYTQVYLQPTAELLEEVNNRFHNHYLQNFNPNGGKS